MNFLSVFHAGIDLRDFAANLNEADLRRMTNDMIDAMLAMIDGCIDNDVTFVPNDPEACDPDADNIEDLELAWTLGHVVVHTTASAEEAAAIAAELARGVTHRGGRSRCEVPWQTLTTVAQCRNRLEESRRMRLASLDMWPDIPYLENSYPSRKGEPINATLRFLYGLLHDDSHLDQISRIATQAKAARSSSISR